MIVIKDVDGLYTADPRKHSGADFIPNISVADLLALNVPTLPFDPSVLDLMMRARLAKRILVPGNLTLTLNGEEIGNRNTWAI